MGVGVRHALFPGGTRFGALAFAGGVLPDATLRGMRMFRSHGGTVLTVAGRDLLSEASSPGSDAPCRERRAGRGVDTAATTFASSPLPRGRHQLLAGRLPRVTGLTSYLSGCLRICSRVIPFCGTAPVRSYAGFARSARSPPPHHPFAPGSRGELGLLAGLARRRRDCVLVSAVATKTLWGNCVSARVETPRGPDSA